METLVPLAERQALLSGGAIAFFGDKINDVPWQRFSLPLCIVVCGPEQFAAPVPGFYDHKIDLPEISVAESKKLWEKFVKVFKDWEPKDREIITGHYQVVIGDIVECSEKRVTTLSQAREIINRTAQHELGELAQRIECAFDWPDIVIDETLKKRLAIFTTEARERKQFWEKDNVRKLFPYGRGLIGLCAGPPGTGKTMAAQIMAKNLNLELFRINLSSIISKYVGETSQNLTRILRRAAHLNCVLFFDEADALFTRRTDVKDAHDRYANIDTDTLLQEVENYPGIILMATNKKTLIDNAFIRRIRYYFEFAKPDREQRERIFLTVAAELLTGIDYKRLAPFFKTLAETLELTGSQIKFSLLTALFVASQSTKEVNREHIVEGIEMELLKEGRLVSRNEKQRL
ncbi:MAG: AAA family ATPase [Spirochaetia bacterium]